MAVVLMDLISAILLLAGAGAAEEMSESEMERFYHYAQHPLRINQVPKSRLLSCGLFSAYQVDAIEDYKSRSGDILSLSEFALVDGIGPVAAEALSFFVSFDSSRPPGMKENIYFHEDLMVRGGYKVKGGPFLAKIVSKQAVATEGTSAGDVNVPASIASAENESGAADKTDRTASFGLKYHLEAGERMEFFWSTRRNYSLPATSLSTTATTALFVPGTVSLALYGRRGGKMIIGDFSARFGQGLALWSSFSMSGFSTVDSFRRNAGGFSPTSSFTSTLCGLAGDYTIDGWTISTGLSVPALRSFLDGNYQAFSSEHSLMPILALSRLGRFGQFGVQAFWKDGFVASADGVLGLGHWTLFGEAALSSRQIEEGGYLIRRTRLAALAGVTWSPAYKVKAGLLARYYPSGFYAPFAGAPRSASTLQDETGLALGCRCRWAEFTSDAALHPEKQTMKCKTILNLKPVFSVRKVSVSPSLRWTESWNTALNTAPWKHELRADISASWRGFQANTRIHFTRSKDWGRLVYLELGYKTPSAGLTSSSSSSTSGAPSTSSATALSSSGTSFIPPPLSLSAPIDYPISNATNGFISAVSASSGASSASSEFPSIKPNALNHRRDSCQSLNTALNLLQFSSVGPNAHNHRRDSCQSPDTSKAQPEFSIYIRGTIFNAPNWADRIYCYERDLPGSFYVPAFYGRGGSLSSLIGFKSSGIRRFRFSLYLKCSFIYYLPPAGTSSSSSSSSGVSLFASASSLAKPPVAEIKLQFQAAF